MIVCSECGTHNAAGSRFCSNCGNYLAWEEHQGASAGGPPSGRPEEVDPPPRPRGEAPDDRPRSDPRTTDQLPPLSDEQKRVTRLPPPDGSDRLPSRRPSGSRSTGGDPPSVPPGESPPPPPRPVPRAQEAPPAPGEIICPRCGAGNAPERHFCRRCAQELRRPTTAVQPGPAPRKDASDGPSRWLWAGLGLALLLLLLVVVDL